MTSTDSTNHNLPNTHACMGTHTQTHKHLTEEWRTNCFGEKMGILSEHSYTNILTHTHARAHIHYGTSSPQYHTHSYSQHNSLMHTHIHTNHSIVLVITTLMASQRGLDYLKYVHMCVQLHYYVSDCTMSFTICTSCKGLKWSEIIHLVSLRLKKKILYVFMYV